MKNGFTLIELLLVLIIVSLASAWVFPRFAKPLESLNTISAAKHVLTRCRYARNLAISKKKYIIAHFDLRQHQLLIVQASQKQHFTESPFADALDGGGKQHRILDTFNFPDGITIDHSGTLQPKNVREYFQIRFFPSGRSTGGKVLFSGESRKQYLVSVDFITGTTRLSRVD